MRHLAIWISSCLLLSACVERIELDESLDGKPLVVIEGTITDANEPYQIRLSYASTTLRIFDGDEISGAEVYIEDETGRRAVLTETKELGTYETDSTTFRGRVGGTYTLHVTLPDSRTYASRPETILPAPPIDSIYYTLESRTQVNLLNEVSEEWGLQFYVDTGSGEDRPGYYRWTYAETYQFFPPLSDYICFQTIAPTRPLVLASTQDLRTDQIERQAVNFVEKTGRKLQIRYSLLIRQQSLTERAYRFWQNVQEQQTLTGSVFDPPPAPIPGNLYSTNNEQEVVLGYFSATGVAEKRIFVSRSEVPVDPGGPPGQYPECDDDNGRPANYCYSCLQIPGTTTEPPSFW